MTPPTLHAPLRKLLTGCEFSAEAISLHEGLSDGARWAIDRLARHIGECRTALEAIEAKLAMDAGGRE